VRDLSLKGIARRYRSLGQGFSVIGDVLNQPSISGSVSLRARLEDVAREEHAFDMTDHADCDCDDCRFGWTASFRQTWTHLLVMIRLNPDAGITQATMNGCMTTWLNGIVNTWNHQWGCYHENELVCRFSIEVQWVASGEHHAVQVTAGGGRANMGRFYTAGSGRTAAHECGHLIGHMDEYADVDCPGRAPTGTGTIMDTGNTVPARMMVRYASNIGGDVIGI
jgi:hypothetical protein